MDSGPTDGDTDCFQALRLGYNLDLLGSTGSRIDILSDSPSL